MSRNALIAVIAGALVVVAVLAVITPTVLVDDHHHERGARVHVMHGDWTPFPGAPGPGFRGGTRPTPAPGR